MNEIEIVKNVEKEEWFDHLIEDCKTIITENEFNARWAVIECYHQLGSRIIEENNNFNKAKIYGKKITQCIAESLGKSQRTVEYAIQFVRKFPALENLPDGKNVSWFKITQKYLPDEEKKLFLEELKKKAKDAPLDDRLQIINGDFRVIGKQIKDSSVDLILTDPPYPKEFLPLWKDLAVFAERVLKPGAFLVSYSGQLYLPEVMRMLGENLEYYWLAGLHHEGHQAQRFERHVQNAMKPILIYFKPPMKNQEMWLMDLVTSPAPSKEFHEWGQSLEPVKLLLETFSLPNDLVVDPFGGGGTTALACKELLRQCVSIEIEKENVELTKGRIA